MRSCATRASYLLFLFGLVKLCERYEALSVWVVAACPHAGVDRAAHVAPFEYGFERALILRVLTLFSVAAAYRALVLLLLSLQPSEGEGEVAVSVIPRPETAVRDAESRRGL
ncbi:hypothetical protein [Dermabacter vaginalis]|uniref:Secreted protein n=1 Tax=Dermabacter vaginalis TaxID=1630135 RepID=A0ABX6A4F3_9MICO|nr:hypothetical protein [Dermabacter vaginalis]QEU11652.1 hypothetical protein FOB48_04640 [Dermabacter vaginalis]